MHTIAYSPSNSPPLSLTLIATLNHLYLLSLDLHQSGETHDDLRKWHDLQKSKSRSLDTHQSFTLNHSEIKSIWAATKGTFEVAKKAKGKREKGRRRKKLVFSGMFIFSSLVENTGCCLVGLVWFDLVHLYIPPIYVLPE